jgi:hypothetical protein
LEVNRPTPFGCPKYIFVSPPHPDGRNFLRGGSVDLFWNDPFANFLFENLKEISVSRSGNTACENHNGCRFIGEFCKFSEEIVAIYIIFHTSF